MPMKRSEEASHHSFRYKAERPIHPPLPLTVLRQLHADWLPVAPILSVAVPPDIAPTVFLEPAQPIHHETRFHQDTTLLEWRRDEDGRGGRPNRKSQHRPTKEGNQS